VGKQGGTAVVGTHSVEVVDAFMATWTSDERCKVKLWRRSCIEVSGDDDSEERGR
jgi:hypothetical protein